jgi:hypothetical protein
VPDPCRWALPAAALREIQSVIEHAVAGCLDLRWEGPKIVKWLKISEALIPQADGDADGVTARGPLVNANGCAYRFGRSVLDTHRRLCLRDGTPVPLTSALEILLSLVSGGMKLSIGQRCWLRSGPDRSSALGSTHRSAAAGTPRL